MKPLYAFPAKMQERFIEGHLDAKLLKRTEGSYGEIFCLERSGQRFAAKCPRISRFGNPERAREALERAIYEIERTRTYQRYGGIHGFAPPLLILGWPFFRSQMRDGTLSDLIVKPGGWDHLQKLATLIQIAHALNYCRSLDSRAHQDLKPANIFIQRVRGLEGVDPAHVAGFTTIAYVADFGIADAFRHIGKNSGSPPYRAPEQYESTLLVDESRIDVFALGVIAFECFSGGLHPIGKHTRDVWPKRAEGEPRKWEHEDVWKKWARGPKELAALARIADVPDRVKNLVGTSLAADPALRPDMEEVENELWLSLRELNQDWAKGVRMQIETNFDSHAPPGEPLEWPYMDQCIGELRIFYSQMA